jgi:hypothetical protein
METESPQEHQAHACLVDLHRLSGGLNTAPNSYLHSSHVAENNKWSRYPGFSAVAITLAITIFKH